MNIKSYKPFIYLVTLLLLSACGFDQSDETSDSEGSASIALPKVITQSKLPTTGTISATVSINGGSPQAMTIIGSNATFTSGELSNGSYSVTITIEYTENSDPNNPITLAEATNTVTISGGNDTQLSLVDSDYDFTAFDDDNDLIGNLDELLAGSNPMQVDLLREIQENVSLIPSFPPTNIVTPATFSITGGDDSSFFNIDGNSGAFSFTNAPDFETPTDLNSDNKYLVDVTILNADGTTILPVFVSVTDQVLSNFSITYPTTNSNLGGEVKQTFVTGKIVSESAPLIAQDINFVDVNGTIAIPDPIDPSIWSAQISVDPGLLADPRDIPLTVSYELSNGAAGSIMGSLSNEPLIDDFTRKSDVDRVNERLIVANRDRDILIAIDLSNSISEGTKSVISDNSLGSILKLGSITAYDETSNKAYTANDAGAIFSVDLADGSRNLVSFFGGGGRGSGPEIQDPRDIVIDAANNRAYVSEGFDMDKVYAVALNTGDRTVFSFSDTVSGVGSGIGFNGIQGIALDAINSRLLVVDADDIIQVNLNNGDRTAVNANLKAFADPFSMPNDVAIEPGTDIAYVVLRQAVFNPVTFNDEPQIVKVELASGITTKLSGFGPTIADVAGTGPAFGDLDSIDVFGNDVIAPDSLQASILKVNRSSGNRTILTDNSTITNLTSTVPSLISPGSLAQDSSNNRLLIVDSGLSAIMAIDLVNGERSIFSNSLTGNGPAFQSPEYIILDSSNDRALVTDSALDAVLAVDLANGNRSIVTDNSVSFTGPAIDNLTGITLDTPNNRIIVVSRGTSPNTANDSLLAIDPSTGNRQILTDNSASFPGPDFNLPEDLIFDDRNDLDVDNDRILVRDGLAIFEVDNDTGEKSILSDNISSLSAKDFEQIRGLAIDTESDQLLVIDRDGSENVDVIQLVDLGTGLRTLLSINPISLTPGSESGLILDNENNRAFITSNFLNAVLIIDLISGESAIMSL